MKQEKGGLWDKDQRKSGIYVLEYMENTARF